MIVVEPIALTEDTAVLRRRDYDALIQAYEDAADALALAEVRGREAAGGAEYVPVELVERVFVGGEHPVRVWREHRGLTLGALAKAIRHRAELFVRDRERQETRLGPRSGCARQGAAGRHRGSPGAGAVSPTRWRHDRPD